MSDNYLEKVKVFFEDTLKIDPEKVVPEANILEDLGADSMSLVELIMTLEDDYNIDIPDEDIKDIKTVGDMIEYLKDKVEL